MMSVSAPIDTSWARPSALVSMRTAIPARPTRTTHGSHGHPGIRITREPERSSEGCRRMSEMMMKVHTISSTMPIALMSIVRIEPGRYQLPRTAKSASTTTKPTANFGVRPAAMSPSSSAAKTASSSSRAASTTARACAFSADGAPRSQRGPMSRAANE